MSGTLTTEQSKWLEGLVKPSGGGKGDVAAQGDVAATRLKTRQQVLDGVVSEVGKIKGKLAEACKQYELITKSGTTMKLLTGELDPDKEIDTHGDIREGTSIKNPDALKAIQPLYEVLVAQTIVLRDAKSNPDGTLADGDAGDPLFTEGDIADEVWTPLVRSGALPETLVQKRYSEVAKLFSGAQAEYAKRLEAFSEQGEKSNDLADSLGLGGEAVNLISKTAEKLAPSVLESVGASGTLKDNVTTGIKIIAGIGTGMTVTGTLMKGVNGPSLLAAAAEGLKLGVDGAGLLKTTEDMFKKAVDAGLHGGKAIASFVKGDIDGAIGSVADGFATAIESVGKYHDDPSYAELAGRVKGSIKSLAAAKKLYQAASTGGTELIDAVTGFIKEAGELVAHEIKTSIEVGKRIELEQKKKEIADELDPKLKEAQRQIEQLTGECFAVSKVQKDIQEIVNSGQMAAVLEANQQLVAKWQELLRSAAKGTDPEPIAREMEGLLLNVAQKVTALEQLRDKVSKAVAIAEEKTKKLPGGEPEEEEDEPEEDEAGDDKISEIMAQLEQARNGLNPEDALVASVEAQARLQKMQEESDAFSSTLSNDFTAAMNETDNKVQQARLAVSKLAPMIEQLKKDQQYLKLADTVVTVGAKVAAAMFEELGPLGSFKECATNIYGAISHMQELTKWEASMADSRNAGASGLVAAEFNRVGLEKKYRNTEWMNAAIKAVETLGGIMKVTGLAAPIGIAMEGVGKTGGEVSKLVTKFYTASELKTAWQDYQAAMEDPENRKNVRRALRSNATLAKYALAWAATSARDPLARDAMRAVGLSDAVLADKDTNAQAVVEYLETVYDRDPIVLQATPTREDWWPGTPALSSRNWIKFVGAAEETPDGLQSEDTVLITQLIVRMEKNVPADFPEPIDEVAVKRARAALDELIEAFEAFAPIDVEGEPNEGMRKYADALLAHAELKRRRLPATEVVAP